MVKKRQLVLNATLSVVQVIVVGATFFFLYSYLLQSLGEDEFGVWAVVLATTSVSGIANLGLAGGATKYVSKYLAREDALRVQQVIETSTVSVAVGLGAVLVLAYPLLRELLAFLIEPDSLAEKSHSILPYALLSFWLTSIALVFLSCVGGFQRIDLSSGLQSVSALIYLVLAYIFVPLNGLIGLAQAQVIQASLLCIGAWAINKALLGRLPVIPFRWTPDVFREMIGYGANFQVISIARMLFEPTTTSLLAKFGGVAVVGYYEMARRMVIQLRAIFVTANEVLVPTIADIQEREPAAVQEIYAKSFRILMFLIAPALPLFIGLTPVVSHLWIGTYNPTFVTFSVLLFIGWFLNLLAGPAYFANMGTGDLRWNVISHVVNGLLNLGLGVLLGWLFGGTGVVIGFVAALILASAVIAFTYESKHRVGVRQLFESTTLALGGIGLAGLGVMLGIYYSLVDWNLTASALLMLITYSAVVAPFFWFHPMRHVLQASVRLITSSGSGFARQA